MPETLCEKAFEYTFVGDYATRISDALRKEINKQNYNFVKGNAKDKRNVKKKMLEL